MFLMITAPSTINQKKVSCKNLWNWWCSLQICNKWFNRFPFKISRLPPPPRDGRGGSISVSLDVPHPDKHSLSIFSIRFFFSILVFEISIAIEYSLRCILYYNTVFLLLIFAKVPCLLLEWVNWLEFLITSCFCTWIEELEVSEPVENCHFDCSRKLY